MTTQTCSEATRGRPKPPAAGTARRGEQKLLREWVEGLGPAAVITFLTHDEYERELREERERPDAPPFRRDTRC